MDRDSETIGDAAGTFSVTVSPPFLIGRSADYFWFPTLTVLASGALLASVYAREDSVAKIPAGRYLWSRDSGKTWSAPQAAEFSEAVVAVSETQCLWLPFALRLDVDGTLRGPLLLADAAKGTVAPYGEGTVQGFPRPLAASAPCGASGWAFSGQTAADDGGWLATLYGKFLGDTRQSLLLVESPNGRDWRIRSVIADAIACALPGKDGPSESALVRRSDGSLLCVFRLEGVFADVFTPGSHLHARPYARTESRDGGRTWTPAVSLPEGIGSVQPCLVTLQRGGFALTGGRPGLWLWLSSEGEHWEAFELAAHHNRCHPNEPIRNADETTAYTELVPLHDGTFALVYDRVPYGWRSIPPGSPETNSVWCVRLNL